MVTPTVTLFFWYVFPMLLLVVLSLALNKTGLAKKTGLKAPDVVTPVLLIGIHYISKETFDESFLPYVVLMICLVGMLIAVFQAFQFKEIIYKRYIKMLWRIVFLLTLLIYVLLILVSIILFLSV